LPLKKKWNDGTKGIILSAFYWGYIVTQIPGGWLSKKYGSKLVFGWGIAWAAAFTIIWPFTTNNFALAVITRVLTGIGEGVTFPAMYHLLALWYPRTEKSTVAAAMGMAPTIGTVIANGLSPSVIKHWQWESVFYLGGGVGVVWSVLWFLYVTDSPNDFKSVSCSPIGDDETLLITTNQDKLCETSEPVSYYKIIREPAFIVLATNHFAYNWGYYVFASWLPTYLKDKLGFDLSSAGIISFLPYLLMSFVGIPSGFIVDRVVKAGIAPILYMRKIFQTLGTVLPAIFLFVLSFWAHPTTTQAVTVMILALVSAPFTAAGCTGNFIDISTKHCGVLFSLSNTIATIPGITGVYLTGYILEASDHNWSIVFLLAAGIYLFAMVVWNIWAKAEQIDFDKDPIVTIQEPTVQK